MDKDTFGNYKASRDLSSILTELGNKKFTKIVSNCLRSFFIGVIELKKTERGTEQFLTVLKNERIDYINNRKDLPIEIRTRVCNIICARYKETIKEIRRNSTQLK